MMAVITWLLIDSFPIVIIDMDSVLNVVYSDVVLCGVSVDINNYPMDGQATTRNLMTLLKNLNYKQHQQIMSIWNGFHMIALMISDTCMVYLLGQLNLFHLR